MKVDLSKKDTNPIIKCLHCGDAIQSLSRYDYVSCSCESVSVDGGSEYCRTAYQSNSRFIQVKDERDLDATSVGPRDNSKDPIECYKCDNLIQRENSIKEDYRHPGGYIEAVNVCKDKSKCKPAANRFEKGGDDGW